MTTTVDFIFDFGSPNAYLSHRVIPEIEVRTGAKFRYVPCLLGGIFKATGNQPPMLASSSVKNKLDYEQLEMQRFIKRHGLSEFRFNPHFPVNTLTLMRGAIAAARVNLFERYIEAGLVAMWERGLKMDDAEVFVDTMNQAGLEGQSLLQATREQSVKDELMANTQTAVERGCFGIPTFFVDDEIYFGKDRLPEVEAALADRR